jgi:hypothetical protein
VHYSHIAKARPSRSHLIFRDQKRTIAHNGIAFTANLLAPGTSACLPEISLVAAMLEDAVRCVQLANRGVTRRQFLNAFEWIASERCDWPFAFVNVCGFLKMDPAAVRKHLRIWGERAAKGSRDPVTQKADARSHAT